MRNRKGYTLIELMVALVILLAVTGSIYKLLVSSQRLSRPRPTGSTCSPTCVPPRSSFRIELRELNTVVGGTVGPQRHPCHDRHQHPVPGHARDRLRLSDADVE